MADYQLVGWKGGEQVFNNRKIAIVQHTGPASYTVITPGTAPAQPTGGDTLSAVACGLVLIEAVIVLGDSSGKYTGRAFQPPVTAAGLGAGTGAAVKTVPLQWNVAATGAEVAGAVNLSTFQLNLMVIGY